MRRKGIFCLEGDWSNDLRRPSSVEPILELLDHQETHNLRHVHHDVATVAELEHWLRKWRQNGSRAYRILYLAFHGEPGKLLIGDLRKPKNVIDLDWLAGQLDDKCSGRIIFFGGCSVMNIDARHLKRFLRTTGAVAVCGYCADVDWVVSAAFELIALRAMQHNAFIVRGARAIHRRIRQQARGLVRDLDFRMVVNE